METKDLGNYRIKIYRDEIPDSPRDWDNLGTMVCFHRRYNLGDKHDYNHNDYSDWEEMKDAIDKNEDSLIIIPLYLYDHSGLTISTTPFSCPWDSGQIGFIFVSKKRVREEYGVKRISPKIVEKALKVLEGEVETYDTYLRGEVYGFQIHKIDDGTFVDGCSGYYGRDECIQEAEGIVNNLIKEGRGLSVN